MALWPSKKLIEKAAKVFWETDRYADKRAGRFEKKS